MRKKITIIAILNWLILNTIFAFNRQDTIIYSGYAELYYAYDFTNPTNHLRPNFTYNHVRHNEININLATAKVAYSAENIRANFTAMFGNYAEYNLSSEPGWAQFVYEANIGVKLSQKHNLWLDAGIMPSHLGFESAIGADCWTLTRSILAENSPYYETGLKLSYTNPSEKFFAAFYYLNGWQKIAKIDFAQKPSIGMQFTYKPHSNLSFNYSNFIGSTLPDSMKNWRLFHNLYAIYEPTAKLSFVAGFDFGNDFNPNSKNYLWFSPVFITKYKWNKKIQTAARIEYYADPNNVIISQDYPSFKVFGASFNLDYQIHNKVLWRNEIKYYQNPTAIFLNNNRQNTVLTTALCIRL
ncbi:MAG: porin [Saprospiraceae bacterium]|nr:porin [Saprospiraceae bacterium]